jgi:archaemetzincin
MKLFSVFLITVTCLAHYNCNKHAGNFLQDKNRDKIIALQPLDSFDTGQLDFLRNEISSFYNRKVIILKLLAIPGAFPKTGNMYSADSTINFLYRLTNDTIIEVIGLTHKNIYITAEEKKEQIKGNVPDANLNPVFGLGDVSGNFCVVSDYLIHSIEPAKTNKRLRTIIIHEMGHNLGLQHCPDDNCIMSEQNGKISTLDKSGNDYCSKCKSKLKN